MKDPQTLFFSILIPAHNEESYIVETMQHIEALDYPKESYEVVVVENGSTDSTLALARAHEREGVRVFTVATKGVSKARNFGLAQISEQSDWVISLDCDTLLKRDFLKELSNFLLLGETKNYSVGTTELVPDKKSAAADFWFAFYNLGHKLTKTSMAIQVFRRSLFPELKFPENLRMGEDLEVIVLARKYGSFFYLPTKNVVTSVRRFEQVGWFKLFLHWNFVAILPKKIQQLFDYKIVR